MTEVAHTIAADFDRDGIYEFDLRPYIDQVGGGFRVHRGLADDGTPMVSQVTMSLNNHDGIWTADNMDSALYGQLVEDVPVQIIVPDFLGPAYAIWTGYTKRWEAQSGPDSRCLLTCQDIAANMQDSEPINVLTSDSRYTDDALVAVMDAFGLSAADYDFDPGIQLLPIHFAVHQKVVAAWMDAIRSEMGGYGFPGADGRLRFQNRHARLGVNVDDTWGDGTDVIPETITRTMETGEIATSVTVIPTVFASGQANTPVWVDARGPFHETPNSPLMAAGQVDEFDVEYGGPIYSLVAPVAGTDYAANTAIGGSGTDKTSALTIVATDLGAAAHLKITNTDAGAVYRTKLQLRAQPVPYFAQGPRFTAAKSAPGVKTVRGAEVSLPFVGDQQEAKDYAMALLRTFRHGYPKLSLAFAWANDAIKTAMLKVELGDLRRFTDKGTDGAGVGAPEWVTQIDEWWYVESIDIVVTPTQVSRSVIGLSPSYLCRNLDEMAYDLFERADASGDLGTSTSGKIWSGDGNMDIVSTKARANSTALQIPVVTV